MRRTLNISLYMHTKVHLAPAEGIYVASTIHLYSLATPKINKATHHFKGEEEEIYTLNNSRSYDSSSSSTFVPIYTMHDMV